MSNQPRNTVAEGFLEKWVVTPLFDALGLLRYVHFVFFGLAALVLAIETLFWLKTGLWQPAAIGLAMNEIGISMTAESWTGLQRILDLVARQPFFLLLFAIGVLLKGLVELLREDFYW